MGRLCVRHQTSDLEVGGAPCFPFTSVSLPLPQPSARLQRPGALIGLTGLSALLSVTRDQAASGQPALGQTLLWVTLPILSRELQAKIVEAEVLLTVLFLPTSLLSLGFSALPHTSFLLHLSPILPLPPPTTPPLEHQD